MTTEDKINNIDEATQLDGAAAVNNAAENKAAAGKAENKKANGVEWKRVMIGGVAGLTLGAVAPLLMGAVNPDDGVNPADAPEDDVQEPYQPHDVNVATGVNDGMTYAEAFAEARHEVGPGGVFQWHGQVYGTYHANEWDAMTDEDKAHYTADVAWSSQHGSISHMPHDTYVAQQEQPTTNNDEEVVAQIDDDDKPELPVDTVDDEFEVIGVVHFDDDNTNMATLVRDGEKVYFYDADGDERFDYVAMDVNGNDNFDDGEIATVDEVFPGQTVTVDMFGGFTDGHQSLAQYEEPVDPEPFDPTLCGLGQEPYEPEPMNEPDPMNMNYMADDSLPGTNDYQIDVDDAFFG